MKTKKNSKTKKGIIDTYYNETYEVYLVVADKNVTLKQLQERYTYSDGAELTDDVMSGSCTTSTCKDKKTEAVVLLVKYNHESYDKSRERRTELVNIVSHEATHVALDTYELCSQSVCFCSPEPFCYLQAWAAERIYKTLTK